MGPPAHRLTPPPVVSDLNGRVALVTGSSSGIGAAVAATFAQLGARVVVNSVSSVADGEQLAAKLPDAMYVQADVSDPADAKRLVGATVERYGRLDIVVNDAVRPSSPERLSLHRSPRRPGPSEPLPRPDLAAGMPTSWPERSRVP
jgi:NAD(P)-dependent dehydrogenase (short-subunit alcohol dehydrogenase family)